MKQDKELLEILKFSLKHILSCYKINKNIVMQEQLLKMNIMYLSLRVKLMARRKLFSVAWVRQGIF